MKFLIIVAALALSGCGTANRLYALEEDAAKDAGNLIYHANVSLLCNKTTFGGLRRNLNSAQIVDLMKMCVTLEKETE